MFGENNRHGYNFFQSLKFDIEPFNPLDEAILSLNPDESAQDYFKSLLLQFLYGRLKITNQIVVNTVFYQSFPIAGKTGRPLGIFEYCRIIAGLFEFAAKTYFRSEMAFSEPACLRLQPEPIATGTFVIHKAQLKSIESSNSFHSSG